MRLKAHQTRLKTRRRHDDLYAEAERDILAALAADPNDLADRVAADLASTATEWTKSWPPSGRTMAGRAWALGMSGFSKGLSALVLRVH